MAQRQHCSFAFLRVVLVQRQQVVHQSNPFFPAIRIGVHNIPDELSDILLVVPSLGRLHRPRQIKRLGIIQQCLVEPRRRSFSLAVDQSVEACSRTNDSDFRRVLCRCDDAEQQAHQREQSPKMFPHSDLCECRDWRGATGSNPMAGGCFVDLWKAVGAQQLTAFQHKQRIDVR